MIIMRRFGIIVKSPKMERVLRLVDAISKTPTTVLLIGETGTGKELIAQAIHKTSNRADKPFVAINCGAIPHDLMERELFGNVKGAFTGAYQKAIGKLEYANGGTVFLDEISTLTPQLQVKLLRVIQEKSVEPIGSLIPIELDVRFIAAANVNLYEEVKKGNFREDLYYRLNVLPIELPPLRERTEDIPLLLQHFIEEYAHKYNKKIVSITDEAMNVLMTHSWPGNIRELQNLSEVLVVLWNENRKIDVNDLPKSCFQKAPTADYLDYNDAMRSFEKEFIRNILSETGWNKTEAAKKMGIHRNTLLLKMKEFELNSRP
ncbi:MAG TPA: sigma-54 dependent transcriptional regulator [Thermodesulfobacteriota bacterium]